MPTSHEVDSVVRATGSNPDGAGEPSGEPAPPPGILGRLPDEMREKLPDELVDELLAGAKTEEEIVGSGGLLSQLSKRLVERAMEVELTDHLGYEPHQEPPGGVGNTRNGSTPKTLVTEHGPVDIRTPRDRDGSFEPKLVRKRQRRFEGFDEKILALYARGMSTRDIEAYLAELYGVSVGRDLISRVTDAVLEDVKAWQQRPLDDVYPVLFLDAFVLKIRDGGSVQRKACYLAMAITMDGRREVLGMWFQATRGRQVLDAGPDRPKAARRPRHPDLLRRRAQGVPRGDRGRVPPDGGADVHRPFGPPQPEVRTPPRL
jgi:putative transposase